MNSGQVFCDLAYAALSREEAELKQLANNSRLRRSLSVGVTGEAAAVYMIQKEALRGSKYPRVMFELPYQESNRKKVDVCFVDAKNRPYASFELKVFADFERGWGGLYRDVEKHLAPGVRIEEASDGAERYNALLLITENRKSKDEMKDIVIQKVNHLVRDLVFYTSDEIKLNPVQSTNPNAGRWNFLGVVVFTGTYVGSSSGAKKTP